MQTNLLSDVAAPSATTQKVFSAAPAGSVAPPFANLLKSAVASVQSLDDQASSAVQGLMTMKVFLEETPNPDEAQIREALSGNLCRCTGYQHIVEAVQLAAERMRK